MLDSLGYGYGFGYGVEVVAVVGGDVVDGHPTLDLQNSVIHGLVVGELMRLVTNK